MLLTGAENKIIYEHFFNQVKQMLRGFYPIEKFIVSKTLKGTYVDRTKIVHAVLADRIGKRDAGLKPQIGDRLPYVYIDIGRQKQPGDLQGDFVEHPNFIIQNNIPIDYMFYLTNQI